MAPRMYPPDHPVQNASRTAEPVVYYRLRDTLSDEWTVIHSLGWLNLRMGKKINPLPHSQGEIDFVLLHPSLGVYLIEVKGGTWRYNGETSKFELIDWTKGQWKVRATRNVVGQTQKNKFALRELLQAFCKQLDIATPPYLQVGMLLLFPECDFDRRRLPPEIYDPTTGKKLVLGQPEMAYLGDAIEAGAQTWKESFFNSWQGYRNSEIGTKLIQELIEALRPIEGYELRLARQIEEDQKYLELRPEQAQGLSHLLTEKRAVVIGGSGTGKTILLVEAARRLAKEGNKILLLTYNRLLTERLQKALTGVAKVMTYTQMRQVIAKQRGVVTRYWSELDEIMKEEFKKWRAIGPPTYDTLLIDEAQSFNPEWIQLLVDYYCDARILICHDELQTFEQKYTSEKKLLELLGVAKPYRLSVNLRSPQAVFERLNQIEQPLIQRFSPRPPDPRMLQEYVIDERHLLEEVTARLDKLAEEGVTPEEIVILTKGEVGQLRQMVLPYGISTIRHIRGFRGCEAPVVIVLWTEGWASLDSAELRCAYARATTCTIVLFTQTALHGGANTQLGQVLLADPNCTSLHSALCTEPDSFPSGYQNLFTEEEIIAELRKAATCVVQDGVWLGWLPWNRGAWLLDGRCSSDEMTQRLWLDALLDETKYPVYRLIVPNNWLLYLPPQQKKGVVYPTHHKHWVVSDWPCHSCGTTNVVRLPLSNGKSCCTICLPDNKFEQPPLGLKLQVQEWAESLHTVPSTKQTLLPLSLHALAHWRHSPASPSFYSIPSALTLEKAACRVWLLAALTHLEVGHTFTSTEAQQWLYSDITKQHSWKNYIGIMLNAISQRVHRNQWLERVKKGTFRRKSAHPALLMNSNWIESEIREVTLWTRFFTNLDEPAIYDPDFAESTGGVATFYLPRLEWWLVIGSPEQVVDNLETSDLIEHDTLYLIGLPGEHQGWGRYSWHQSIIPYESYDYAWNWTIENRLLAIGNANIRSHPRLEMAYQAARRNLAISDIEEQKDRSR